MTIKNVFISIVYMFGLGQWLLSPLQIEICDRAYDNLTWIEGAERRSRYIESFNSVRAS